MRKWALVGNVQHFTQYMWLELGKAKWFMDRVGNNYEI